MAELSIAFMESRLEALPKAIHKEALKTIDLKQKCFNIKAEIKNKQTLAISKEKIKAMGKNICLSKVDLVSISEEKTYELRVKQIVTESEFRKSVVDGKLLENEFIALRKIAEIRKIR